MFVDQMNDAHYLHKHVVDHLTQYNWPGNVRGLEHVINRATLKARVRQRNKAIIATDKIDCGTLNAVGEELAIELISESGLSSIAQQQVNLNLKVETESF
jgi:anaerobic nitric oxide reductase transcription regulator